nr:helix-turn-helix domain-containing protein [Brevibacterium sp. ZH18]
MDLPPHLASAPRRVLSRWEQAERDSLLQALVDAQGNKVQAAELLGIGRSTLYRKLRSLSIDQLQIDALRSDFSGEFSGPHAQRGARSASGPAHR